MSIKIEKVKSKDDALKVSDLYIQYYKQNQLTKQSFLKRWKSLCLDINYYMFLAFLNEDVEPTGFIAFSNIPSLFWAPSLIRIDSIYVKEMNDVKEQDVVQALFDKLFFIAKEINTRMICAVTCSVYKNELKFLSKYLSPDDTSMKNFFIKVIP